MSSNPAKLFGMKHKGEIRSGNDADITVVDLEKEEIIKGERLFTKAKWTPFDGFKTKGKAVISIINGNVVYDNGKLNENFKGKEIEVN